MQQPFYPLLYQINTRILLQELSRRLRRTASLDDIPDEDLDSFVELGFDWVWLLGVWQTGLAGRLISRAHLPWRAEFQALLPDFREEDICGSPFGIRSYSVHADFGTDEALLRLRQRLHERGLRLLLDFVPNHTALDHPWVFDHPEFYIAGDEGDLAREPHNYRRVETRHGARILAHGRDPNFPGWTDTFQLNYRHGGLREAMHAELAWIVHFCDGLRCDMAMLLLPEIIQRTWGRQSLPSDGTEPVDTLFWPEAIARVREVNPGFLFLAEVYWDLEWMLQQQGFDYTYDKRLYDRLRGAETSGIRAHLRAGLDFQNKCAHFLENHDEPRAASVFPFAKHQAAALLTYVVPGMRFFHEGQLEGRRLRASLHLCRRAPEAPDREVHDYYLRLLDCLRLPVLRTGEWQLLNCTSAWPGNCSSEGFIAFSWQGRANDRLLVAVNYADTRGQCHVKAPWSDISGTGILLRDLITSVVYERSGTELAERGLYVDLPPWGRHVFEVTRFSG
jgi:hypothetical protein